MKAIKSVFINEILDLSSSMKNISKKQGFALGHINECDIVQVRGQILPHALQFLRSKVIIFLSLKLTNKNTEIFKLLFICFLTVFKKCLYYVTWAELLLCSMKNIQRISEFALKHTNECVKSQIEGTNVHI